VNAWTKRTLSMLTASMTGMYDAGAQPGVQLQVSSGAGTDQRGVRSSATTIAPIITLRDTPASSLLLFGSATRFGEAAHSLSGGSALRFRTAAESPFGASLAADGGVTVTSFDARFANVQVIPSLEWRHGPLMIAAGARAARGLTSFANQTASPPGGGLGGVLPPSRRADRTTTSRTLWGPQAQAALLVPVHSGRGAARFTVDYGAWNTVASGAETDSQRVRTALHDVSVGGAVAAGRVTLQGTVGRRFERDGTGATPFGSAQLEVALTSVLALNAGGGHYLADPVTTTLGGRFLTAGVSMQFGGARTYTASRSTMTNAPRVRGMGPPATGMTRLAVRAPSATSVMIAGDWNNWTQHPARKASDDVWFVDLALEPGEYRYAFLIDGRTWRVPDHAVTSDDGFGGKVAWLSVRASAH